MWRGFGAAKAARRRRYIALPSKGVPSTALVESLHNKKDRPGEEQVKILLIPRGLA